MKMIRFTILVLLLVAGALMVFGSPGEAERDQAAEASETAAGGSNRSEQSSGSEAEPLETFVPSERLPADSAISFPVDI